MAGVRDARAVTIAENLLRLWHSAHVDRRLATCCAAVAVLVAGDDGKVCRHPSRDAGGDALHRRVPCRQRPWHHLRAPPSTLPSILGLSGQVYCWRYAHKYHS
jgi:hypothetical protein